MSFRHHPSHQFKVCLPDVSMPDWNDPAPCSDAGTMRGLHLASEAVLRLRGDAVGAEVARVFLEKQLALTTCLIDELLLKGTDQPTTRWLAVRPDRINRGVELLKTVMSALTVIISIWAMVAICAILFIRGASPRVERPAKPPQRRPARFSIAE
jgi:hypothetical protein